MDFDSIMPHNRVHGVWSGGQFSMVRLLVGCACIISSLDMLSFNDGFFSLLFPSVMMIASFCFSLGYRIQEMSIIMVFASVFFPSLSKLFWPTLYIWFNSCPAPYGSIDAIKREDPRNGWCITSWTYNLLWVVFWYGIVIICFEIAPLPMVLPVLAACFVGWIALPVNMLVWIFWFMSIVIYVLGFKTSLLPVPPLLLSSCGSLVLFLLYVPIQATATQKQTVFVDFDSSIGRILGRFILSEDVCGAFTLARSSSTTVEHKLICVQSGDKVVSDSDAIVFILSNLGCYWKTIAFVLGFIPTSFSVKMFDMLYNRKDRLSVRPVPSFDSLPQDLKNRVEGLSTNV